MGAGIVLATRPLNYRERCLQRLWMRVLKLNPETHKDNLGRNDNFFRR